MSFHHHPEFHRIIMQDKKLRIPKKYVEKYWKEISNPIFLRFPNGVEQKIFWKVKIFGEEINYFDIKSVEVKEEDVEGAAKDVFDLSDDESVEDESDFESDDECEIVKKPQRRTSKRKIHMDLDSSSNRGVNVKKVKKCSTSEAFNVRDMDENPFFKRTMTDSYASGFFLMLPTKFSREHLNNFVGTAFLQVGKDMPMKVNMKFDFINRRLTISRGWKEFRERYNLQVDDSCKFVIIQCRPLVFIVVIERAAKGPSPKKVHGWRQVGGNLWKKGK
ncbi:B3 domain-containing transcription factor VRN1 [Trifolium repens]|nr:B3 domain-containing transcription factor VRN1 [Trifolium repens]